MVVRVLATPLVIALLAGSLFAQTPAVRHSSGQMKWRALGTSAVRAAVNERVTDERAVNQRAVNQRAIAGGPFQVTPASNTENSPAAAGQPARSRIASVSSGSGNLPNDHGQIWREYDIAPYTRGVTGTDRPEQAIVDWILRETGYEAWHGGTVAVLGASDTTLTVYHTPDMQSLVADVVDRFANSQAKAHGFSLRIVTLGSPNWRAKALPLMKPVPVQSQGIQGWLLAKEDAALLLADLRKRTDFREHSSPNLLVNNGQTTMVEAIRPRSYVRGVVPSSDVWPGFNPEVGQLEEGYSLRFSPLLSLDESTVDAVINLKLNQVEKMIPVVLELPSQVTPRQRTRVEVPQMSMCNLHERFHWPADQVLLLSMGVVGSPAPTRGNPLASVLPLASAPARVDALLFVESRGVVSAASTSPAASQATQNYSGRY